MHNKAIENILERVAEKALPDTGWMYKGQIYDTKDLVSRRGLLSILMRQVEATDRSTGLIPDLARTITWAFDGENITGFRYDFHKDTAIFPLMLLSLDTVLYAKKLAPLPDQDGRHMVDIGVLEKPTVPTADIFFKPDWEKTHEIFQEKLQDILERKGGIETVESIQEAYREFREQMDDTGEKGEDRESPSIPFGSAGGYY